MHARGASTTVGVRATPSCGAGLLIKDGHTSVMHEVEVEVEVEVPTLTRARTLKDGQLGRTGFFSCLLPSSACLLIWSFYKV